MSLKDLFPDVARDADILRHSVPKKKTDHVLQSWKSQSKTLSGVARPAAISKATTTTLAAAKWNAAIATRAILQTGARCITIGADA